MVRAFRPEWDRSANQSRGEAPALTSEKFQALLGKIISRILRLLIRVEHLVEEEGVTYVADAYGIDDPDNLLAFLHAGVR